ncbi:MAG: carbohydrate binding family 9 domain-containing protein [Bacteroidales bacterium]|nr:carbohydrate binding family 9 domain-containing protein [Bacteroidales bacterium]
MSLHGQDPWIVPVLTLDIVFDGMPDESAWKDCTPFPLKTLTPVEGNEPSEKTDARLCFDNHYLYLGAHLYYEDRDNLRAIGKKRDYSGMNTDWLGILIDSYNDKENCMAFTTNPNALRFDATVKNDGTVIEDNEPINMSWNTFWDARTNIDEEGWHCEIRIPVSTLRFQETGRDVVMGISIIRWIPYLNEMDIYPPTPYKWGNYSHVKPSQFREANFSGLHSKKPLYITPYILSGFKEHYSLNNSGDAYRYQSEPVIEPGLDIKYGINPNTTLDLTVNTDFAQVESDEQQFNLTRFALFYEEKRVFFLERESTFDFNLGGPNTLFYSRRIGLHEGEPVRIWGGARVINRTGKWDIGFLDLQTAKFDDLPSENFAVFRAKRNVLNNYSYAGAMLTSRIGADGTYNMAYGLDCNIKVSEDDYITLRWAQTFENGNPNNPFSLDPTRWMVSWVKRRDRGFAYDLMSTYSGIKYNPGIGFQAFEKYWVIKGMLKHTWISPEHSKIKEHILSSQNYNISGLAEDELLSWYSNLQWRINLKNGTIGFFTGVYNYEFLPDTFHILDPVFVPPGKYHFFNSLTSIYTPMARPFYVIMNLEAGQYYDGIKISPELTPTWNVTSGLELSSFYRFDRIKFSGREQLLSNHILGMKVLYMLNTRISFSAFVQYNTAIDKVISNFRFRYNPREGSDLYIVFDEGRNTWLEREVPTLPSISNRSIMVKYTYTFAL